MISHTHDGFKSPVIGVLPFQVIPSFQNHAASQAGHHVTGLGEDKGRRGLALQSVRGRTVAAPSVTLVRSSPFEEAAGRSTRISGSEHPEKRRSVDDLIAFIVDIGIDFVSEFEVMWIERAADIVRSRA